MLCVMNYAEICNKEARKNLHKILDYLSWSSLMNKLIHLRDLTVNSITKSISN